jgi:hypothetical protein
LRYFQDFARLHEYDLSNQTFARWLNYSLKSTRVPFLDGTEPEGYEQAAPKLGMAPGTVAVTVHRGGSAKLPDFSTQQFAQTRPHPPRKSRR